MQLQDNINYLVETQKDAQTVAKAICVSPNTISLLRKRTEYDPKLSTLLKIAKYFKVSLDDLVYKDLAANMEENNYET